MAIAEKRNKPTWTESHCYLSKPVFLNRGRAPP